MSASAAGNIRIADRTVHRFGFGAMRLTGPGIWGPPADRDEALRVVRRAVELGVQVIDTAWYYGQDVANGVIAEALRPYPDDLLLVTKLGGARRDDGSWFSDLSDGALRAGNERDLHVLGVDCVPVTHLRWPDAERRNTVPLAEALGTMQALQREGRIRHIGLSNITLDLLDEALAITEIATVSNAYSVANRDSEAVLECCVQRGIAFLPYFPLDAGKHEAQQTVARVAQRLGATAAQVGLAWLLAHAAVTLPIPGTSRVAHLEENLAAAELSLDAQALSELESL